MLIWYPVDHCLSHKEGLAAQGGKSCNSSSIGIIPLEKVGVHGHSIGREVFLCCRGEVEDFGAHDLLPGSPLQPTVLKNCLEKI